MVGGEVRLRRGAVWVLRLFDVADEIDLARARTLVTPQGTVAGLRPRPGGSAIVLARPPLSVPLGRTSVTLAGDMCPVDITARLFDFGALGVRLRIPLPTDCSWDMASRYVLAAQTDAGLTLLARQQAKILTSRVGLALQGPHDSPIYEDYVVLACESAEGAGPDRVARLLAGEPPEAPLSAAEVQELLRHQSSYDGRDLCVPGWSTAWVVEPSGETDVLDLLELANAQLLGLRGYDQLLDQALDTLYADVARRRGRGRPFRHYRDLLHRAMALVLELAEFVERVENVLKVVGDTYLARLYASVVEVLRVPAWQRAVTHKQALLQQVYDVLKHEVQAARGLLVEVLVVVLILMEIVLALSGL